MSEQPERQTPQPTARIFLIFLRLGLTSFGGPIAHLGYFQAEFVQRRRWLSEAAYADLVALCQFLPGPASSQTGFAIGLMQGGWRGALAAWAGFTLPSAIAMVLFAHGAPALDSGIGAGVIAGLKVLAVAIVAHAVLGMGRSLCVGRTRTAILLAAMALLALWPSALTQILCILLGALLGILLIRDGGEISEPGPARSPAPRSGLGLLILAVLILAATPLLARLGVGGHPLAVFDAFYRAGALVFGGGHVVLPLLQQAVVDPGWVTPDAFLAGYGAAQAVPGPLFTFAAYLGAADMAPPSGLTGATIALIGIFLPGCLLVAGALPYWDRMRRWSRARSVLAGVNAAVVGILAIALYDPVFLTGIRDTLDLTLATGGFLALSIFRAPVWTAVLTLALAGGLRAALGI